MRDENNCSSYDFVHQVIKIEISKITNTSLEFQWSIDNPDAANMEFLPSRAEKSKIGNTNAWYNQTDWTSKNLASFDKLKPYTEYLIKIYVRKVGSTFVYPTFQMVTVRTSVGSKLAIMMSGFQRRTVSNSNS